jgi:hypothetical protein
VDGTRVRAKRRAQAEFLADLIQARQTADPAERIVSVGDYNAYQFSDGYVDSLGTIQGSPVPANQVVLPSADLVDPDLTSLVNLPPADERYSYSFDGNAQILDHVLVNQSLLPFVRGFRYARVDADFPEIFRNDPSRPERISDHDPAVAYFSADSLGDTSPATLWVGLKNSDDQGTRFDVRAQLYVNSTLLAEGLTRCVTGVTRNPSQAKEVAVPFGPVAVNQLAPGDVLSLKVSTRIGTNPDDSKCGGHNSAVGLRLYYDAASRPSRFGAELTPDPVVDQFLHSLGASFTFDTTVPAAAVAKEKDSGAVNFAGGNPWAEVGTWSRAVP